MKTQKFFNLWVIFALVLSLFNSISVKVSHAQENTAPSSITAPEGYKLIQPQIMSGTSNSADILLIQTALPWASDADMQVLNSLGYTYDIVDMSNIGNVNLFSYPVILIVNDQVQAFYDEYAAHVTDFESYISSGHTLVFFAAGYGWAGGVLNAPLPGGITWNFDYLWNDYIINSTHPIVTDQLSEHVPLTNGDLYSNFCNHGWFSNLPANTDVILSESPDNENNPTLIEYQLGKGRVIASTLTWEHNWLYHTGYDGYGSFARKSLDDVFLYAFSGGTVPADVKLSLRVDDSSSWISVNKSRGSYIDLVAQIKGDAAYQASVTLQVPSDKFGSPIKTFVRDRDGDPSYSQENEYTNPGIGQYEISSTLKSFDGQYYREMVWRFIVPSDASPEQGIELSATITVPNHTVSNPISTANINIIDYARSIIVTNRKLLFSKYQPNPSQNDVSSLLEEVYIQAWAYNGEVFYLDLYNDLAGDWNQDVDYSSESSANTVATAIDELIEGWYNRLTKHPHWWETIKPEFLLIIGGDEIIPFFRADDRSYGDEEIQVATIDDNDPVGRVPHEHFLLTDNIYSDIGGGKSEWELGLLELSTGRIIGHSAFAMHQFIDNAWLETPALNHAVMATRSEMHEPVTVRERLNSRNVTIYGETDPDLTENDNWTRDQWLTALQQQYQVLAYQGHGAYDGWYGTDKWTNAVTASDQPTGNIDDNHPLFAVAACNFAIPTDLNGAIWNPGANDNISWKLISLGAGGILSSTGINTTAPKNISNYGERLFNDYFGYLIDANPGNSYSEYFGTALLEAKQNYLGSILGIFTKTDRKAMMEYVYYGLPWSFIETPDNPAEQAFASTTQLPKGYEISNRIQQMEATSFYNRDISFTVSSYQFTPVDGYEIIEIPGANTLYSLYKPVLPVINTTIMLPPGSAVSGIDLVNEHSSSLGNHAIPAADPITGYNGSTGYTSTMDVTGIYPPLPRFGYAVVDMDDHVEVRISLSPATFDVDTQEVVLYDSTELRVNYSSSVPVAISSMSLDKPQYNAGEIVTPTVNIDNISPDIQTLSGVLSIYDVAGNLVETTSRSSFDIAGGGTYSLQISSVTELLPGSYSATISIEQAGTPIATASQFFNVMGGKLTSFEVPSSIFMGEYGEFNLSFKNFRSSSVNVTAKVYIYDSAGIEVTSLLERSFVVDAGATASTSWLWNPSGLPTGSYTAQAVVKVAEETYSSSPNPIQVQQLHISGNAGVAGATLSYTDSIDQTVMADDNGNYSLPVSYNWSGTVTPSKTSYIFTPDHISYANILEDQTDQDYFATTCYSLTIAINPVGGGSVTPNPAPNCTGDRYVSGTNVQLTAVPNNGYVFIDWTGDTTGSTNPVSILMDGDKTVTVNFGLLPGLFNKSLPSNSATDQPVNLTLSWDISTDTAAYWYCYDTTNDSLCSGTWTSNCTATSKTLNGLNPYTSYYWQVRAVNSTGATYADGGTWWFFKTAPLTASFQSNGANDGWVLESNAHTGVGGSLNTTSPVLLVGDDALNRQYRSILSFDTSSLPDTAVITQVILKVVQQSFMNMMYPYNMGGNPFTALGSLKVDIRKGSFGSKVGLEIGDFQAAANKTGVGIFGATPVINLYAASLGSSAFPNVNLGGTTQFRLRFALDSNNNSAGDNIQLSSGNAATTADRPMLIVKYYVP
jgi:hypothetical protein